MEPLTPEDEALLLTQIKRLADQQLSRVNPASAEWRTQWRTAAQQAGLLGDPDWMLWSPVMAGISPRLLRVIAYRDAGAALLVHREAQGSHLAGELGLDEGGPTVVALNGALGLGRRALGRWLRGAAPDEEDSEELAGNWGPGASRLLQAGDWRRALAPVWARQRLQWWQLDVEHCVREEHGPVHAFEGLSTRTLSVRRGQALGPVARGQLLGRLIEEQRGLLAIGAGVVDRARDQADAFAAERRQGGRTIAEWPAVQRLLADLRGVSEALDAELALAGHQGGADLARLLRRRADLAASTVRACNQAMQVHGGSGYMRDLGVERLVREANALRVISGSPLFLPLLAEHMEQAS